ncbi:MAG: alanine racemase [Nakamurella sp.]
MPVPHAEAVVDLQAITANARRLKKAAGAAELMAVVKADGYGHGAAPAARAALAGGATVVGVATLPEAIAIRAAGIDAPLVAWLWAPGEDVRSAIAVGTQVTVSSRQQLRAVIDAADSAPFVPPADGAPELKPGCVAIHVKVDTGMARNGVMPEDLPALLADISAAQHDGTVRMVGLMSHLACADVPSDPSVEVQIRAFRTAIDATEAAGLRPRWRHLANTAATLAVPAAHFDMVRCGIGLYGLSPLADRYDLLPAMTMRTHVALTKRVESGQGVGYGLTYHTDTPTLLALVPVGYGDGIPRGSGNRGEVFLAGRRRRIVGRVSMDQIVVDCGDGAVHAGDEVLLFGSGTRGEPTADDWAGYCDTINYEVVTRISPRVTRRYVGGPEF